jgi:hypothetical protein
MRWLVEAEHVDAIAADLEREPRHQVRLRQAQEIGAPA